MNDAVFISDLHLHPNQPLITKRFIDVTEWVSLHAKSLYILGDFFHVWAGDDGFDDWSESIAARLAWLAEQGIAVFFMPGNRDFLLGKTFDKKAKIIRLREPAVIRLDNTPVLLVHGDRYCTRDKSHQWLRRLTRNDVFETLFLMLPRWIREKLVGEFRQYSQQNRRKTDENMTIVPSVMLAEMKKYAVRTIVHGHIHRAGKTEYGEDSEKYEQYVLSDWDDSPQVLIYNRLYHFRFERITRT